MREYRIIYEPFGNIQTHQNRQNYFCDATCFSDGTWDIRVFSIARKAFKIGIADQKFLVRASIASGQKQEWFHVIASFPKDHKNRPQNIKYDKYSFYLFFPMLLYPIFVDNEDVSHHGNDKRMQKKGVKIKVSQIVENNTIPWTKDRRKGMDEVGAAYEGY